MPSARRLLGLVVFSYFAVVAAVFVFQTKLIYFPARAIEATPETVRLPFDEVTLTTKDGIKINAWFVPNRDAKGTILFFHGNGGNNGDRVDILRVLHSFQFNIMIVDYRGYGKSEGNPSEQGTYLDALAAWEYLTRTRGIPDNSIVVMGESLGGAVAIDLASRYAPGALVVQSTFTCLADVAAMHYPLLPVRWLIRHYYDSLDKIERISCPKLFIHSEEDTLIPIANAKALFDRAKDPKQFMSTPGDHNEGGVMYAPEYTEQLRQFLHFLYQ